MYDPPWHLSSFLSQMCKHYYPWVILSGVVKIRSLSSLLLARHAIKTRQAAAGTEHGVKKERGGGGRAMEMEQMFVWPLICGVIRVLHRQLELMAC